MAEPKFKKLDIVRMVGQKQPLTVWKTTEDGNGNPFVKILWIGADGAYRSEELSEELFEIIPYQDQPYRDI